MELWLSREGVGRFPMMLSLFYDLVPRLFTLLYALVCDLDGLRSLVQAQ